MDALERIERIRRSASKNNWSPDEFQDAAIRARELWQAVESLFGVRYGLLTDAVSAIDPTFELPDIELSAIRKAEVAGTPGGELVATWFAKWDRCPVTRGIDNPYEPLVEILEHGGAVSKEHGQFIDIYDQSGKAVAGLFVRSA